MISNNASWPYNPTKDMTYIKLTIPMISQLGQIMQKMVRKGGIIPSYIQVIVKIITARIFTNCINQLIMDKRNI